MFIIIIYSFLPGALSDWHERNNSGSLDCFRFPNETKTLQMTEMANYNAVHSLKPTWLQTISPSFPLTLCLPGPLRILPSGICILYTTLIADILFQSSPKIKFDYCRSTPNFSVCPGGVTYANAIAKSTALHLRAQILFASSCWQNLSEMCLSSRPLAHYNPLKQIQN